MSSKPTCEVASLEKAVSPWAVNGKEIIRTEEQAKVFARRVFPNWPVLKVEQVERDYSCLWQEGPMEGEITIRRLYRGDAAESEEKEVSYNLSLEALGLDNLPVIPEHMSFDWAINYTTWVEGLNISPSVYEKSLLVMLSPYIQTWSNEVLGLDLEDDSEDVLCSRWDEYLYQSIRGVELAGKRYSLTDSRVWDRNFYSKLLRCMRGEVGGLELESLGQSVLQNIELPRLRRESLFPLPALYFDEWTDPRFTSAVPAALLRSYSLGSVGDSDVTVHEKLDDVYSNSLKYLDFSGGVVNKFLRTWDFARFPPNLINLVTISIPVLPAEVRAKEKELTPIEETERYRGQLLLVIVDEKSVGRINPMEISRELDTIAGKGSWVVVARKPDKTAVRLSPKIQGRCPVEEKTRKYSRNILV